MYKRILASEKGQAFVELALLMPIFIVLLVGAAEVGRLAYASIEVANAARAGVSYAAQNHATASDTANILLAAQGDAPDVTSLTATAVQACTCVTGTTAVAITCGTAGTACLSPSRIVVAVQVNTIAAVDTIFHLPILPNTVTLRGQAIMRVQQ